MKLSVEGQLRRAVWGAFAVGAVFNSGAALAQDSKDATQLQGVEVTGSRIRRVDTETSDPVQVIDRKQIQASGAATLGDLLQSIPSFGGTPFNSQVNNGGGSAASTIDLRGLGSIRTLILLDGQRLNDNDVNAIPTNLIERVEVLKEGAGAVYGTDAIGGVVNFITRRNFTGVEAILTGGSSQKGDAENGDVQLTWGSKVGGGNVVFGASFNRQDEVTATSRPTSAQPSGYSGDVFGPGYAGTFLPLAFSSGRGPAGSFNVGSAIAGALPADPRCPSNDFSANSGSSVTLLPGRSGTSVSDYRRVCANFGAGFSDRFNFQPDNLSLIPSKRLKFFGTASLPISENVKWFGTGFFNQTRSLAQLAAEPFDTTTIFGVLGSRDGAPVISSQSIYNPFGRNISAFTKRSNDVGERIERFITNDYQFQTGLKGTIADRFTWDLTANYGRQDQQQQNYGFLNFSQLYSQIGPSFIDATGTARCGTTAAVIANCSPINVFGTTGNTLAGLGTTTNNALYSDEQDYTANIAGDLFNLPAGPVGLAVGGQYRTLHIANTPDELGQEFNLSEANSQITSGGFNVREVYAEARIPILAKLPGVKSLDINAGVRYSNYSSFGSNTSGKYALEYRPYSDVLVRATYSDVFRAPTTFELFQGATQTAPQYTDPCTRLTAAQLAAHPIGCENVAPGFVAANSQANANNLGNADLQPEKGFTTDFGLVFSPSFYKPLQLEVDYYRYHLRSAISRVDLQTIVDSCFADEASAFCGNAPGGQKYFVRAPDGNIANAALVNFNSTKFDTRGVDASIKLNYPKVSVGGYDFGRFSFGIDVTYLQNYQFNTYDPLTNEQVDANSVAGQYDNGSTGGGSFPRIRGLGFLFWSQGPYAVSVQDRYIGNVNEKLDADTFTRKVGAANYVDIAGTYTLRKINTDLTAGVRDAFSEGGQQQYSAQLAGAGNPLYPIVGREFYGRITLRFK